MSSSTDPPPHLHRHAIESILGFLSIDELMLAALVSREWSASTLSMAPLRTTMIVRHASAFSANRLQWAHASTLRIELSSVSCDVLRILAPRAPHLTDLQCTLSAPSSSDIGVVFPQKLVRLVITLSADASRPMVGVSPDTVVCDIDWSQRVLEAASQLPLESFQSTLLHSQLPKLNFACLMHLTRLRDLKIFFARRSSGQLADQHIDAIRSMPWLRSVHIDSISTETLRLLLRTPHNLQWSKLDVEPIDIDTATGECIATLPLTSLRCSCEGTPSWLPRLASTLSELSLRAGGVGQTHAEELCAQLCSLVHLTRLSLAATPLDSTHMARILQSMSSLRHLSLRKDMYRIESLSFIAAPGVPQLESLSLEDLDHEALTRDPGHLLCIVRSLLQLRSLSLAHVWDLSSLETLVFEVPSLHMPQLQRFEYQPAYRHG